MNWTAVVWGLLGGNARRRLLWGEQGSKANKIFDWLQLNLQIALFGLSLWKAPSYISLLATSDWLSIYKI